MKRLQVLAVTGLLAGLLLAEPARLSQAIAQVPTLRDDRFAGLQWTFVRIRYTAFTVDSRYQLDYWGEPWAIDAPAAEQNLSRRLRTATAIEVNDPIVLGLEDPALWEHAWIYLVEPGNLRLNDAEVSILREFLLRGGTATFDDFHGPLEWDNFAKEMKRVFPDRDIVDLEPPHPIYSSFYSLHEYPQVPGLGSFFAGRSWEKAASSAACAPSWTMPGGRWCWRTGTRIWGTASNGPTPRNIRATSSTPPMPTGCSSTRSSTR